MKTKQIRSMGIMLVAAGMFFLINPVVNIIDFIPDFIGYILIAAGLDRLADMEDHFASARRSFVILAVVSGLKCGVCGLLPFIDGTFIILLSFIFAVAEAVCFIPAVINLFGGFHYYGIRLESNSCYGIYKYVNKKDENKKKIRVWAKVHSSDSVLAFTVVAFLVRAVCYFLPQLPTVFDAKQSSIIQSSDRVDWTVFIPHFYVIAGIIAFAVSLPWAIRFFKYIKGIAADKKLMDSLEKSYNENIAPNEGYFAEKTTSVVWILTLVGAVFCFSIYIDYVNWLPGGVAGALFAVVALLLRKTSKWSAPTAVAGFVSLIPSALEVVFQYQYAYMKYTPSSFIYGIGKSGEMYPRIMIAEALTAVCLIVTVGLFSKCLEDMTASHSVLYEKAMPETRTGKGAGLCHRINVAYRIAFALMTAMAVASGVHGIIAVYYPEIWLVNVAFGIAMLICLVRARGIASDELYDKLRDRI